MASLRMKNGHLDMEQEFVEYFMGDAADAVNDDTPAGDDMESPDEEDDEDDDDDEEDEDDDDDD